MGSRFNGVVFSKIFTRSLEGILLLNLGIDKYCDSIEYFFTLPPMDVVDIHQNNKITNKSFTKNLILASLRLKKAEFKHIYKLV